MTALLILFLAQHAVISAKAGLATYTEGVVNVGVNEHVGQGNMLETGPSGRAEIMLNPDSYLRVLPYTRVRLDSERLDRIELDLLDGTAIMDVDNIDDEMPIRIHLGGLEVAVLNDGVYLFETDSVSVLDGELRVGDEGTRLRKGWSLLRNDDAFSEVRTEEAIEDHPLVRWNKARSEQLTPRLPRRPLRPFRF